MSYSKKGREKMKERQFLVQRVDLMDDERFNSIMTADELVHYIDMSDCFDERYVIYEITEMGKVEQIYYAGWQPGYVIEFVDAEGNVVLSGFGTDH